MKPLKVATDGSAQPTNPGPTGSAWVAEDGRWEAAHLGLGTNNIGELDAIRRAILAHPNTAILVQSDSQYAINCVTKWGPNWRAKGETGKKNLDLVFSIMDLVESRQGRAPVTFEWVRGHNGHALNEVADELADMAALAPGSGVQTGIRAL